MNKTLISVAILLASPAAFAQTCASPAAFNTPAAGPTASGDTCAATDLVSLYCGAQDSVNKPDVIYSLTLAAAGASRTATSISITGAGTGFTPTIFLYTGACATGDGCQAQGETGFPMDLTSVGAGTYLLAVSASQVDGSGACGTYTITANGTLPVSLQEFSVE